MKEMLWKTRFKVAVLISILILATFITTMTLVSNSCRHDREAYRQCQRTNATLREDISKLQMDKQALMEKVKHLEKQLANKPK